ncbi:MULTISPECIES: hypothetical protein [Rugamonas]|uniref:Uncharacterized protein n=2 Tax=Rugamonas TaxID=212744 RepID=A0A843SJS3_9BURK|nr:MULTISPECIES: hypothetical protein [Rugamonas]MQA20937.1 hypothetical protein [Rugamonas rivuli]MQA42149.1 hypothetical protein [Rugamonas aquatica]
MLAALREKPADQKMAAAFSVAEASLILGETQKALHRARAARDEELAKKPTDRRPIDPLSLESIACVQVSKKFKYPASEIEDYLARFEEAVAGKKRLVRSAMPPILGFQSWMATASPVETWPFSIQRGGRPMDMCAAIIAGKLTGKAEDLTLREFSERLADASARAFHLAQARALDRVARPGNGAQRPRRAA